MKSVKEQGHCITYAKLIFYIVLNLMRQTLSGSIERRQGTNKIFPGILFYFCCEFQNCALLLRLREAVDGAVWQVWAVSERISTFKLSLHLESSGKSERLNSFLVLQEGSTSLCLRSGVLVLPLAKEASLLYACLWVVWYLGFLMGDSISDGLDGFTKNWIMVQLIFKGKIDNSLDCP